MNTKKLTLNTRSEEINKEHVEDEISAGFILIDKNTKEILLGQGRKFEWKPTKGHINQGETLLECAIRETFEEVGINVPIDAINLDFHFVFSNKRINRNKNRVNKAVHLFLAVIDKNNHPLKLQEEEIMDAGWFDHSTAREKVEEEVIRNVIEKAYQHFYLLPINQHHLQNIDVPILYKNTIKQIL
eukprot:TRINITY_DN14207_c0_g1_i1.p1 TRINITY_DN14207_c0_g1~~TRINITY_DN14207_c0_g1_i1.p1  ORF type:complete len:186 (+),score=47.24 TRINITY_DN14207_c0_g1_i1:100-657(+)